jgi:hypothetical protein
LGDKMGGALGGWLMDGLNEMAVVCLLLAA